MINAEIARHWYPENDPVHGFDHIARVVHLANHIGQSEGANLQILTAAAYMHDVKANSTKQKDRASHEYNAASFAEKYLSEAGWPVDDIQAVVHCILAHRFRNRGEPQSIEAKVLFDADKLDSIGAVGIARAIAYAAKSNSPFYAAPSKQFLSTGKCIQGEPHSAYHEYLFKLRHIIQLLYTQTGQALAVQRQAIMVDYFLQLEREIQIY